MTLDPYLGSKHRYRQLSEYELLLEIEREQKLVAEERLSRNKLIDEIEGEQKRITELHQIIEENRPFVNRYRETVDDLTENIEYLQAMMTDNRERMADIREKRRLSRRRLFRTITDISFEQRLYGEWKSLRGKLGYLQVVINKALKSRGSYRGRLTIYNEISQRAESLIASGKRKIKRTEINIESAEELIASEEEEIKIKEDVLKEPPPPVKITKVEVVAYLSYIPGSLGSRKPVSKEYEYKVFRLVREGEEKSESVRNETIGLWYAIFWWFEEIEFEVGGIDVQYGKTNRKWEISIEEEQGLNSPQKYCLAQKIDRLSHTLIEERVSTIEDAKRVRIIEGIEVKGWDNMKTVRIRTRPGEGEANLYYGGSPEAKEEIKPVEEE